MILGVKFSVVIKTNLICLVFVFGLSSMSVFSLSPGKIDIKEVPQKKVRKYIEFREIDRMDDFSSIHASWVKGTHESDYSVNQKTIYLNDNLQNVWENYGHSNPLKTWNGRSIQLGLLISKYSNSVIYPGDSSFPVIDTGQVYFLNLKLMKGLFNVPVAFEIINVDQEQKILEISYIDNNKSQGKQTLQFFDNGDGRTRIVHRSYFKSDSWLREDIFYPFFHKKFIKEFHKDMGRHIEELDHNIPVQ
jgi:hypothetical protein